MPGHKTPIDFSRARTVLLDMDGTLLDLAFDNLFWLELVPGEYARVHGLSNHEAHDRLRALYASVEGNLAWYCLDHWTTKLGIAVRELKWSHRHLIAYLPDVPEVLRMLRRQGRRLVVVTNAHRDTLAVKLRQTRLDTLVDRIVSSHDYDIEKESNGFWERLSLDEPFDPDTTLFMDDSLAVLEAARRFGLRNVVAIEKPDSRLPARALEGIVSVEGLGTLRSGPTVR